MKDIGSHLAHRRLGAELRFLLAAVLIFTDLLAALSPASAQTWTQTGAPGDFWRTVASSADGSRLIAVVFGDYHNNNSGIYTSTNSGATWTPATVPGTSWNYWLSAACSAHATKMVEGQDSGRIYVSTNSGATWIQSDAPDGGRWISIASSADGNKLVAAEGSQGHIFTSTNSGTSWTITSAPDGAWFSLAS